MFAWSKVMQRGTAGSFSDWLLSVQFSLSSADSCTPLQQWVACCNLAV